MSKKLKIEFIRAEFKKEGYELLTKVYEGSKQKLEYICSDPEKHRHSMTWSNWKHNKRRCPECSTIRRAADSRTDIEHIRAEFAKEGYILLTEIYENNAQKLEYVCPMEHHHSITWSHWNSKEKRRCPYCVGKGKPTIEFVRADFAKKGYILLSTTYENSHQKLEYVCFRGHKHKMCWNHWKSGKECPTCANRIRAEKLRKKFDIIKKSFKDADYILLTKVYKNNQQKLKYICPRGHKHSITWANWNSKNKYRCPFCSNHVSKWEKAVKSFLSELNIDHMPNDRTQLTNPETDYGLELDIWLPKLNKAVECNGLYWHEREEVVVRDKIKKQLCKDQGIDLLVITDREWNDNTDKCKNKIQEFLC